jgi:hypothetical protein
MRKGDKSDRWRRFINRIKKLLISVSDTSFIQLQPFSRNLPSLASFTEGTCLVGYACLADFQNISAKY